MHKKLLKYFIFIFCLSNLIETIKADEVISIIIEKSYGDEEAFNQILEILKSLKKGQRALIFSQNHRKIADIYIDYEHSDKTWRRAHQSNLRKVAIGIKRMKDEESSLFQFEDHIDFLSRKKEEMSGRDDMTNYEGVIIAGLYDSRLEDIKENNSDINFADIIIDNSNGNPFKVENNIFFDAPIHIVFPTRIREASKITQDQYCNLWRIYLKKMGARLASCQSESIGSRIGNSNITNGDMSDEEYESMKNNSQKIDEYGKWENDKFVPIQPFITPDQPFILPVQPPITPPPISLHKEFTFPITIELKWETNETDLDLSIWTKNERLHFNSDAYFGKFKKQGNLSEIITLYEKPKNGTLRIVHSKGPAPKKALIKFSNNQLAREEIITGIFKTSAEYRTKEFYYQYSLNDLIKNNPSSQIKRRKPSY